MTRVGHQKKVGVVQFIKGTWENGERNLLDHLACLSTLMEIGFTWGAQDKVRIHSRLFKYLAICLKLLNNPEYGLVILDEIIYD